MNNRILIYSIVAGLSVPSIGLAQSVDTKVDKNEDDAVISVAYGKQKKSSTTAAISTVTSDDIENASVTNSGNALYGKLSGLYVKQSAGTPGSDVPNLFIRGIGTNTGNTDVLILVDGIERGLDQVMLEDIESVSVLKDAAALSLYGVRGANGVVLITTKRGSNSKLKVGVDFDYGIQSPQMMPDLINSAEYATYMNQAALNDGFDAPYTPEQIQKFAAGNSPFYPNVNWFDNIYKKSSSIWNLRANASGGNDVVKYYVSLGYMRNEGLYKDTDINDGYSTQLYSGKLTFRSNVDINVNRKFKVSLDLGGTLDDINSPGTEVDDIYTAAYEYGPHLFPMLNPNGTLGGNSSFTNNPYGLVTASGYKEKHKRNLQVSSRFSYDLSSLTKGLSVYGNVAFDNYMLLTTNKTKTFAVYSMSGTEDEPVYTKYGQESSLGNGNSVSQFSRWYIEGGFNYARTFGKNEFEAVALYQMGAYDDDNTHPYKHQGFAGRIHYGYDNRYMAELGWSVTASQNSSPNNRWGFFPSISGAWIISNEDFMKSFNNLDFLKLRASFGLTGNDLSTYGRFLFFSDYKVGDKYYFGDANQSDSGLTISMQPNEELKWETNFMYNLGIDARLWKKLDLSVDMFYNRRTDILTELSYSKPLYLGLASGYFNYGTVDNKGVDLNLTWSDKISDFAYSVNLNGGFARSKVIKTGELAYPTPNRTRVGHSVKQIFGYEAIGFVTAEDVANGYQQFGYTLAEGDVKYRDVNEDGVVDENDESPISGTNFPEITFGMNLGVSYKGFSLQTQWDGLAKYNVNISSLTGPINIENQFREIVENSWSPENKDAEYPRLTTINNQNNYKTNTLWTKNGACLRLRMLELGYTLPNNILKNMKISNFKFFVRGMNVLSLDKLKFANPELLKSYPVMKSYHLGFKFEI